MDISSYAGPLVITLAFIGLYYGAMIHVARVKVARSRHYKARGEKFDRYFHQDREMLAADRIQLNLLEHMPPFLSLMWLTAVFVAPAWATWGGGVYLVARCAYPLLIGRRLGRDVRLKVLLSTFTGYGVLVYFCGALVWKLVS